MTDDEAAFLRTICEYPDDDRVRLVFADWLEESGRAEQAEFVRVGCDVAAVTSIHDPEYVRLRRREQELWVSSVGEFWRGQTGPVAATILHQDVNEGPMPVPPWLIVSKGMPAKVRAPQSWLLGGECEVCDGTKCPSHYQECNCCPACSGTGRTPGHLAGLVERWPITRVVVTDREPHPNSYVGSEVCGWQSEASDPLMFRAPSHIPYGLLRLMAEKDGEDLDGRTWLSFPTRDAALAALSDAVLTVARGQVTHPSA
jgi:uncharacterized protein (TIGR02996 family)